MLTTIISGGQTGVDETALRTAKLYGLKTGGWMPQGWMTHEGPKPYFANVYNMHQHVKTGYKPRTWDNVRYSQGTLRIASKFNSPGEICTYNAIKYWNKPFYDIHINANTFDERNYKILYTSVVKWIIDTDITTLNIAGNSIRTNNMIIDIAYKILCDIFEEIGFKRIG